MLAICYVLRSSHPHILRFLRRNEMNPRLLGSFAGLAAIVALGWGVTGVHGQAPPTAARTKPSAKDERTSTPPHRAWTPPRTPWGDPDIQGIFTTDDELGVPFERPEQFAGREIVTDEEFAQREEQAKRLAEVDAEEFVAPRAGAAPEGGGGTGPPSHWIERGKPSKRTSIVIDP